MKLQTYAIYLATVLVALGVYQSGKDQHKSSEAIKRLGEARLELLEKEQSEEKALMDYHEADKQLQVAQALAPYNDTKSEREELLQRFLSTGNTLQKLRTETLYASNQLQYTETEARKKHKTGSYLMTGSFILILSTLYLSNKKQRWNRDSPAMS